LFKTVTSTAVAVAFIAAAGAANAGVTTINSQADFSAAGAITQNTNWDSYGPGFFFPGSPFTVGDETYVTAGQNLIGGAGTGYGLARNLFVDNYVGYGTTIQIAGSHDLFAVNAGNFLSSDTATFTLTTNLGSYTFSPNVSSAANGGALTFLGFEAGHGEHFTSVQWSGGQAPGVTDVQLGAAVPEPTTWAMMIIGLAGLGGLARTRRSKVSAV
jgi:hypothetical protein